MRGAAVWAAMALLACVHGLAAPGERRALRWADAGARVTVTYLEVDEGAAREVVRALPAAAARAQRWGPLTLPVTIALHPSHEAFEAAVGVSGRAWLRGWARLDTVDVQSPRTWWALGARRSELEDFLAHELAHCATYQAAGAARPWREHGLPWWFGEGLAVAAGGAAAGPLDAAELARWYRGAGPAALAPADPHGAAEADVAYGEAHLAFRFLLVRYGDARVRLVLDGLRAGAGFPAAFRDAVGLAPDAFEREFRRFVVWEGWRSAR